MVTRIGATALPLEGWKSGGAMVAAGRGAAKLAVKTANRRALEGVTMA